MGSIHSKGFLFQKAMDSYIIFFPVFSPGIYNIHPGDAEQIPQVHRNPQDSPGKCYNLQEPSVIPEHPNFKHFDQEKDFFYNTIQCLVDALPPACQTLLLNTELLGCFPHVLHTIQARVIKVMKECLRNSPVILIQNGANS